MANCNFLLPLFDIAVVLPKSRRFTSENFTLLTTATTILSTLSLQ
jgi:hypothetical protein